MSPDPGRPARHDPASGIGARAGLTNRQTLFWIGQQLAGDRPVYNIAFLFEIDGPLDPERFGAAFAATVAGTDSLRIVVREVGGEPEQLVLARLEPQLESIDLAGREDPAAQLEVWLRERLARPLAMGERLFDSALVRLAPERFAWFLNQHHIVTDGRSMALIYERVAAAYRHLGAGGRARDLAQAESYLGYVERERAQRRSVEYRRAERYRLRQLATDLQPVSFYRSGPVVRTRSERRAVLRLDAGRSRRLREVATGPAMPARRAEQALHLAFSTLLAVYLHRLSGNAEIGIGLIFHNRLTARDLDIAGLYVNLFPLHLRVEAGETFLTLMRKSMAESFSAVRYGPHCISNPGRQRSYEVLFNYLPMTYGDFAGLPERTCWVHTGASDGNHSLSLHVHDFDSSGELSLVFDFNTGVFDLAEQDRTLADFAGLIEEFLEDPERRLDALALSPAAAPPAPPGPPRPAATPDRPAPVPPATRVETGLVEVWEDLLGRGPIGVDDNFFDLGGHSLLAVSLVTRLEQRFGWRLPLTTIFERPTIAELAASVRRGDAPAEDLGGPAAGLVPVRAAGAGSPFFCVAGAGGHGFRLYRLAHQIEPERPFYTFAPLAGAAAGSLERTAAAYCATLKTRQPAGPYLLGGTCLGALVAFEMARQLQARGDEVALLALLNLHGDRDYRIYRWGSRQLDRLLRRLGRRPHRRHDRLLALLWLARRLRGAGPAPAEAPELRAIALEQTRAALAYRPLAYAGRVTLFMARQTPSGARREEIAAWESVAAGGVEVHEVPGSADTALEPPHVAELAHRLSELLATAAAGGARTAAPGARSG